MRNSVKSYHPNLRINKKAGGVYYTPSDATDYMIQNTYDNYH